MYSCRRVSCEKYAHVCSNCIAISGSVISAAICVMFNGIAFGMCAFDAETMWTKSMAPVSVLFVHSTAPPLGRRCSTVPGLVTMKCGLFVAFWGPMGLAIAGSVTNARNSRAEITVNLVFVLVSPPFSRFRNDVKG
jgi:hypothetical protein